MTIKCVSQQILLSGVGGRKAPNSTSKISTADVLRLRATSAASHDQSVRRCAQDDESVGEPEEKQQVPPLRYPRFPVELVGVGELHAAFLRESRTRGRW